LLQQGGIKAGHPAKSAYCSGLPRAATVAPGGGPVTRTAEIMRSTTERQTTISQPPPAGVTPLHRGPDLPAGSTVVRLDGDLGVAAAPALRERLISVLRPGIELVIVDLSRVQSCDPAGLAVLIGTQSRARERGIVVRLVAPSPPVAELLHSSGLERCLTICPDLPAALACGRRDTAAEVTPQVLAG
jgi:anti-anti-sigma factor